MSFGQRSSTVSKSGTAGETSSESFVHCTACQVVRQSAARPVACAALPLITVVRSYLAQFVFDGFASERSASSHGRAPPLA